MDIDPLAEKYWGLTTYQYGGNNPVFFIDVNGEFIYINDTNGKKYRYENGQAQAEKDGKWTNIDSNSDVSDFVKDMVKGLSELENSGKTGKGLIDSFSGSEKDVAFQYAKGGKDYESGVISIDNKSKEKTFVQTEGGGYEYKESPLFVTIGHEMGHATDPLLMHDSWYKPTVSDGEILASHLENKIRHEAGLPLRSHYGGTYDPVTKKISPNKRSTLIDREGTSVYYDHSQKRYNKASINDGIDASNGAILRLRYNYNDEQ